MGTSPLGQLSTGSMGFLPQKLRIPGSRNPGRRDERDVFLIGDDLSGRDREFVSTTRKTGSFFFLFFTDTIFDSTLLKEKDLYSGIYYYRQSHQIFLAIFLVSIGT